MSYVNFENGVTPLNDINLNNMQDLIKNDIDTSKISAIVTGQENATNFTVDGKTVYCKRIKIDSLPNATSILCNAGLIASEITIIDISGMAIKSGAGSIPLNFRNDSVILALHLTKDGEISVYCSDDRSSYTGYVNIFYTKN